MTAFATGAAVPYVKGHGTGNDFVLLPDLDGDLELDALTVSAVCDRRTGVGGDGVLRIVRTVHATDPAVAAQAAGAEWFMDYRNADGSMAEMCGNGVRVFVRFLLDAGLADRPLVAVATRSGVVPVRVEHDGVLAADLGPAVVAESWPPPEVSVGEGAPTRPAVAVTMPNPHLVVFVDDVEQAGDLVRPPLVSPAQAYPDGVNVEFVRVIEPGHLAMRVWERGVGETASCGTGACAAVVAARRQLAADGGGLDEVPPRWQVDVAGGRLRVTENAEGSVELAGPAVLVSSGVLRPDWLSATGS